MKQSKQLGSKLIAWMLALMMVAAYMPMVGDVAYADTSSMTLDRADATYELGEPIIVNATSADDNSWVGLYCSENSEDTCVWDWHAWNGKSGKDINILTSYNTRNHFPCAGAGSVYLEASEGNITIPITLTECTHEKSVAVDEETCNTASKLKVNVVSSGESDWVAVYQGTHTTATNYEALSYVGSWSYTYGYNHSSIELGLLEKGDYTVALLEDGGYTAAAVENFTVVDAAGPTPAVSTDKTTYKYGDAINVSTNSGYNYDGSAWVGIYQKGQTPSSTTPSISWYYISTYPDGFDITDFANSGDKGVPESQQSTLFNGKLKAGEYTVKLFLDGSYTVNKEVDITIENEPYGEPEVTPAGCEKEGSSVQWYTDGTSESTPIAALEHKWSDYVYDADTKTHSRTCSTTEHDAEVGNCTFDVFGTPDETTTGTTTTYQCSVCGGTYTETVASGFVFVETITVEPTCTKDGETYELYRHETTGEEKKVVLATTPALNHNWDKWTPVGENATTHERVCKNDPEHKETKDCNRNNVSFRVNELVQVCDVCGSEEAEAVLSMEKSVYGVDEDIIVKTNYPAVGQEGKNWIGIFFHTDGHDANHEYPHAPAKGWVYLSSSEQELIVNDNSIWQAGADDKDTFINYNGKGQLMPGEWTVAIILDNASAKGQVSPYLRFTVCDHKWTDSKVLEKATCTEEGLKELICSTCEETKTAVIPALDHDWDEGEVTKAATCEEAGSKVVTCQRDNTHTDTVVIPALDHDWDEGTIATVPTCTEAGVKTFVCQRDANHTKTEPVAIDEKAHDWDEGTVTTAPTCTEEGVKTFVCQRDANHTKTEPVAIDENAHDWDEGTVTTAPTCTEEGTKTFTCLNDCSETKTAPIAIDENAHDWDEGTVTTAPTCLTEGVKTFTCLNDCGETKTEPIAIDDNAHDWDEGTVTTAPTCSAEGVKTFVCQLDAKHTKTEPVAIDAAAHKWDEGTVTTAATCSAEGVKTFVCQLDAKHTKTEPVAIDAAAHKWDEGTVTTEATCTTEGVKTFVCKHDAKHTRTEVMPVDESNHKHEVVETAPTCTEMGYFTYTCECGDMYKSDGEPALGHKMTKAEAKAATCEAAGNIEYYTCDVCEGYFLDEKGEKATTAAEVAVAATGHKYGTYKTKTKAKFGKNGKQKATCSVCGDPAYKTIAAPKTIKLSYTSYTYNGKIKKPTVTVYDSNGKKISSANYKVSYASGRKNVGKYKVTVTIKDGRANYAKSSKYTTFKINPKGTSISKLTKVKKGFTVKWKKQAGKMAKTRITGYQYRYSTSSKMTNAKIKTVKGYSKISAKKTSLKAKKKYYVQVRTYKTVNGTKYYSPWSKTKSVTTK